MQKKFKHKLNMLEPGTKICKLILLLFCAGILLYLLHAKTAGFIILMIAAALILLLLILIVIEQHQDNVLYLDAKKNDPDIK